MKANRIDNRIRIAAGVFLLLLIFFLSAKPVFAVEPAMDRAGSTEHPLTENTQTELSGGMICFLKNEASGGQQLSAVVKSSDGKVVVIDGGMEDDAAHLLRVLRECGGTVDLWLITHAHNDHVGGLYAVLKDHRSEIEIKEIAYCFPEYEWYLQVEPGRIDMIDRLMGQLGTFPLERQRKILSAGDVIPLSEHLSVRIINAPRKSYDNFAVNSSSVMYDITIEGKHLVILGDMGEYVGNELLREGALKGIVCDYLQTAHHGQSGVGKEFYRQCAPVNVIWNSPDWLYEAKQNNANGYQTWRTREWMEELGVRNNYCTAYGDVVIR